VARELRSAILTLYDGPFTQDTTNGINRLEPCLMSGYPAAQAGVGALWYGSNNGCFPGALDLAFVRVWHYRNGDLKKIVVRPDENIAAAGLNLFTSTDNWIYAIPYYPVQGRAVYRFSHNENRLDGWFDLWGYSGLYWSEYSADIWGHWRDDSYLQRPRREPSGVPVVDPRHADGRTARPALPRAKSSCRRGSDRGRHMTDPPPWELVRDDRAHQVRTTHREVDGDAGSGARALRRASRSQ
jgi:hypothetical protein